MDKKMLESVVELLDEGAVVCSGKWLGAKEETVAYVSKESGKKDSFQRILGAVMTKGLPLFVQYPRGVSLAEHFVAAGLDVFIRVEGMSTDNGVCRIIGFPVLAKG